MKAENLRNPKMVLHVLIAASKLELLAIKRNRAFFWDTLYYIYFNIFSSFKKEIRKWVCCNNSLRIITDKRVQIKDTGCLPPFELSITNKLNITNMTDDERRVQWRRVLHTQSLHKPENMLSALNHPS